MDNLSEIPVKNVEGINGDYLRAILLYKCYFLASGVAIDKDHLNSMQSRGFFKTLGRKGGAGPAGGRYFRFENGSDVNTQIWIRGEDVPGIHIYDVKEGGFIDYVVNDEDFMQILPAGYKKIPISLITIPQFYDEPVDNGIPFRKVALLHASHTLATTIHQRCVYWRGGTQCAFCAIEKSLELGATIENKTPEQLVKTLEIAEKDTPGLITNITLTSGTESSELSNLKRYYDIVKAIKSRFPNLKVHIQIEPIVHEEWYQKLHEVGVDTIGIHLEILDENIRRKICPGKSAKSVEVYYSAWKKAIEVFGENQVSSFILTGFYGNKDEFLANLENIIKIGVIPLLTPARKIEGVKAEIPPTDWKDLYDIVKFAAEKMKQYGVNPLKHKAGCIACGACSPVNDAYRYIIGGS